LGGREGKEKSTGCPVESCNFIAEKEKNFSLSLSLSFSFGIWNRRFSHDESCTSDYSRERERERERERKREIG